MRVTKLGLDKMTRFAPEVASFIGFPVFALNRQSHRRSGEPSKIKTSIRRAPVQILNIHIP